MYGSVARFPLSQLLNRLHDPEPHGFSLHVTGSKARVGPHGGFNVGCVAILLDKLIGGAVGRRLQANRHRARRHDVGQFRYINRDWIAYPAQPYCPLSLHFFFNDIAQYQKSYWPNTYPNSQPLCMSFL